jgi:hypothetical protein
MLTRNDLINKRAECDRARMQALATANANAGAIEIIDWMLAEMDRGEDDTPPIELSELLASAEECA